MNNVNREYKDRLFRFVFGDEQNKEFLLSLYNAINDTKHSDVEELEINTLEDVIYMKMKNDVSCLLNSIMSIYEQQSTYNPNMPLRSFEYGAKLYNKFIVSVQSQPPKCFAFRRCGVSAK